MKRAFTSALLAGLAVAPLLGQANGKAEAKKEGVGGTASTPVSTATTKPPVPPPIRLDEGLEAPFIEGQQIWDGNYLYSQTMRNSPALDRFKLTEKAPKAEAVRLTDGLRLADVRNGVAYAWKKEGKFKFAFFEGYNFSNWNLLGTLEEEGIVINDCRVLENGKLLVARVVKPFIKDGKASFFAIYKANDKKELSFDSLVGVDLDLFDKGLQSRNPKGHPLTWVKPEKQSLYGDLLLPRFTSLQDGFAVVLQKTGYVLYFRAKDGEVRHTAQLFPSVLEKDNKDKLKEVPILAYRPNREGKLVIVSRTEDAVLNARGIFQERAKVAQTDDEKYKEEMKGYHAKALEAFPELLWWEFNPETGNFIKQSVPAGLPDKLLSYEVYKRFSMWMAPNNHPSMTTP